MPIGKKLAKKLADGQVFGGGENYPPGHFRIEVTKFTFFESANDGVETFVVESKVARVYSGGDRYEADNGRVCPKVKVGDIRAQVIRLKTAGNEGSVVQFVQAGLGAMLGLGGVCDWQSMENLKALLRHWGTKTAGLDQQAMVGKLFEYLTGEDQPLVGVELDLRVVLVPTRAKTMFSKHIYNISEETETDEEEEEVEEEEEEKPFVRRPSRK